MTTIEIRSTRFDPSLVLPKLESKYGSIVSSIDGSNWGSYKFYSGLYAHITFADWITTIELVPPSNGIVEVNLGEDRYEIRLDGEAIGWAQTESEATKTYHEALRIRKEHYQRGNKLSDQVGPIDWSKAYSEHDTYGLEERTLR